MNKRREKFDDGDFGIVAKAGGTPDPKDLPEADDECRILREYFPKFQIKHKCGHKGPLAYRLSYYGVRGILIYPWNECPQCLLECAKKEIARCSLCGLPIFPGKPVAIYRFDAEKMDETQVTFVGDKRYVLGCMRGNCCPCDAFFAGHWDGENGFVSFFS